MEYLRALSLVFIFQLEQIIPFNGNNFYCFADDDLPVVSHQLLIRMLNFMTQSTVWDAQQPCSCSVNSWCNCSYAVKWNRYWDRGLGEGPLAKNHIPVSQQVLLFNQQSALQQMHLAFKGSGRGHSRWFNLCNTYELLRS